MTDKPNFKIDVFETYGQYLQFSAKLASGDNGNLPLASRKEEYQTVWYGTQTFEDALKLAYSGWHDKANEIKKISEPIFTDVSSLVERHSIINDVEGIQVDVARFLDGEPECWQQWERQIIENPGTKIVKLVFSGFVSAGVSTKAINAVGACVTALVELLEYSGTRVEVWYAYTACKGDDDLTPYRAECRVKIKSADQPLDVPRLAFIFAHPSSFRRIAFGWLEQQTNAVRLHNYSYGSPYSQEKYFAGDITIDSRSYNNHELMTTEGAEAWVIEELRKQGVELKEKK